MTGIVQVIVLGLLGLGESAPDGWRSYAVRPEIAPAFRVEEGQGDPKGTHPYKLGIAGRGDEAVDGRWVREVPARAGACYTFAAEYRAAGVESPERSVLARVAWLDADGKPLATAEYPVPSLKPAADGWTALTGTYLAPEKADR